MSETLHTAPAESLEAIEARAADFLLRRRLSRWTDADRDELDAWLNEATSHRIAYLRFEEGEALIDRVANGRPAEFDHLFARRRRRYVVPLLGMAASFVLIAGLGIAVQKYFRQPADRVYSTDVGGRAQIDFADGTQMALNTDTVLRVRMTSEERTVWLERGEAYFRVSHNAAHPFMVVAGNRRVVDLGTEFLVRSDTGHFEIALLKGRAQLSTDGNRSQVATLTPGDEVVATPASLSFTRKTPQELADETAWRGGVLKFRHTKLAYAVSEFNRYYRTKLVIDDPVVADMAIGGDFKIDGLGDFLHAMQVILKLRVERDGDTILIARISDGMTGKTTKAAREKHGQ